MTPLQRARAVYDVVSAEAPESERAGRLTDRAMRALMESGLFSMLAAREDGGDVANLPDYFQTVELIAKADGSAGWRLATSAAAAFTVSRAASAAAKREVFGDGPVALMTTLLARARSSPAPGGFRVSGRFSWGSGSDCASWAVVNEALPPRGGAAWFRGYLVPRADLDIDAQSWRAMGLEATASADYAIDERFVPAHRSFEYPHTAASGYSGQVSARLHQIGLTAFASGVAARALSELLAAAPETRRLAAATTLGEDETLQRGLGAHDGRWRAARAFYLNLIAAQDRHAAAHGGADESLALDAQQAAFTLTQVARDLTLFAFDGAGSDAVRRDAPLQRALRDLLTGLKHATFDPSLLARVGKARLAQAVGRGVAN